MHCILCLSSNPQRAGSQNMQNELVLMDVTVFCLTHLHSPLANALGPSQRLGLAPSQPQKTLTLARAAATDKVVRVTG